MNRRQNDPEGADYSRKREERPWCMEHHNQLNEIWVTLRGNGHPEHGLAYKVSKIEDRQTDIIDFVNDAKKENLIGIARIINRSFIWMLLGALSAIGLFGFKLAGLLWEHGKLSA
jgi:hypothetical protein